MPPALEPAPKSQHDLRCASSVRVPPRGRASPSVARRRADATSRFCSRRRQIWAPSSGSARALLIDARVDLNPLPPSSPRPRLDVIIEFLTAATHHVLYHRGVYPRELFETRALYGSRVMRCRHPEVVSYVENAIGALRRPIARADVKRVVVVVKDGETRGGKGLPVERHTFDFALNARGADRTPTRRDVNALQKGLCATLSKIAFSDVTLPPLPRGASACGGPRAWTATEGKRSTPALRATRATPTTGRRRRAQTA